MEKIIWKNNFSLEIPQTWSVNEDDGLISLFDEEDGVGVLQLSFARRERPKNPTQEEARELSISYALQQSWNVEKLNFFSISDSPVAEFFIIEDEDGEQNYWRIWHIVGEDGVVFITYNCLASDMLVEEKACNLIVCSFDWI